MKIIILFFYLLMPCLLNAQSSKSVIFYGDEKSRISSGVSIPANKKLFFISGNCSITCRHFATYGIEGKMGRYEDTKQSIHY